MELSNRLQEALSPSEALYGFAGWLTTRKKSVTAGSKHNAAPWAELVQTFAATNDLEDPREGWHKELKHPTEGIAGQLAAAVREASGFRGKGYSFRSFDDPWKAMSSEDKREANRLLIAALKALSGSPKQKELRAKLNVLLKKYHIGEAVQESNLQEGKLKATGEKVDAKATESLRKMKLKAKNQGDLNSAVISAGYYAKKAGQTAYVYAGDSYGHAVWRVTYKLSDALSPINNSGRRLLSVSPDLTVKKYDVENRI
jgi:hypothetical protein